MSENVDQSRLLLMIDLKVHRLGEAELRRLGHLLRVLVVEHVLEDVLAHPTVQQALLLDGLPHRVEHLLDEERLEVEADLVQFARRVDRRFHG